MNFSDSVILKRRFLDTFLIGTHKEIVYLWIRGPSWPPVTHIKECFIQKFVAPLEPWRQWLFDFDKLD
jgi:hypothetical protein